MGGRGGTIAEKGNGSADGVLVNSEPRTIQTTRFASSGYNAARYRNEVLEATTDGSGNVTFRYASPSKWSEPTAKTNKTNQVEYKITHGAVDGQLYGVDMSKAKSISGQTFSLRDAAKAAGMRWDGAKKRWVK